MEPTPLQKKVFVLGPDADYGTFSFESALPKLPVPSLDSTLDKYLRSVQPFVTDEEFSRTRSICENFKKSPRVQELQRMLLKRAEEKQSWMAEWWLDYAYLYYREPLIPSLNVSGPYALINQGPEQHWPVPVDQETSLCYLAQYIYHLVQFWKVLRDEKLKPDQGRDGTRFNMNQFKKLFNSARIPQKGKTSLNFLVQRVTRSK